MNLKPNKMIYQLFIWDL